MWPTFRPASRLATALTVMTAACSATAPTLTNQCMTNLGASVIPGAPSLGVGDTVTLTISFTSTSACVPSPSQVQWEVLDTAVAQIGPTTGLLTGKAVGMSGIVVTNSHTGRTLSWLDVTVN